MLYIFTLPMRKNEKYCIRWAIYEKSKNWVQLYPYQQNVAQKSEYNRILINKMWHKNLSTIVSLSTKCDTKIWVQLYPYQQNVTQKSEYNRILINKMGHKSLHTTVSLSTKCDTKIWEQPYPYQQKGDTKIWVQPYPYQQIVGRRKVLAVFSCVQTNLRYSCSHLKRADRHGRCFVTFEFFRWHAHQSCKV